MAKQYCSSKKPVAAGSLERDPTTQQFMGSGVKLSKIKPTKQVACGSFVCCEETYKIHGLIFGA